MTLLTVQQGFVELGKTEVKGKVGTMQYHRISPPSNCIREKSESEGKETKW